MEPTYCLWGRRIGDEEWQEELLSTNRANFEDVKKLAAGEGFGHFRVSYDDGAPPDFTKVLNTQAHGKSYRRKR